MTLERSDTRDPRIKKIGSVYYARFSKKGVRVEQSLETSSFQLAQSLVNDIEKAILTGGDYKALFDEALKDKGKTKLIGELWVTCLEEKSQGTRKVEKLRDRTLKEYHSFWDRYYSSFWADRTLSEITEDNWKAFIEECQAKSKKGADLKVFNIWKYFSGFCSWCVLHGHLKAMPEIYNTDPEDEDEDGVGKNFTDAELEALREKSKEYSHAFHLCIMMAQFMGMRSSEITQLKKDRVDFRKNWIALKKSDTKTKQARKVPIHNEVLPLLRAQMDRLPDSPAVFPNQADKSRPMDTTGFKTSWNNIREALGIEGRFHDLRHSYASRIFAMPEVNPVMAAKALGMSMATAMKVYIHYSDEQLTVLSSSFQLANKVPGKNLGK